MTATRLYLILASLFGLAGVALLAAAAHGGSDERLRTAGEFCLFHAPAILAATTLHRLSLLPRRLGPAAIAVLILGVVLFTGDLATRGFAGRALFPMAAPIGGSLTMLGWLLLALAGGLAPRRN